MFMNLETVNNKGLTKYNLLSISVINAGITEYIKDNCNEIKQAMFAYRLY